jgi:hypothetical protein
VGEIKIRLFGTDAGGKSATVDFTLKVNNVDDQPVASTIPNQEINERSEYNFAGKDFVYDPDMLINDRLPAEGREAVLYQLFALDSANNEVSAPAWLTIDANGVLHGIPTNADVTDALKLRVKCTDISTGKSISADYYLKITNVNDAPSVGIPVDARATVVNRPFSYTLPELTFIDLDSDPMTFTATLADGSPLPSWLSFDATTRTFSGTPTSGTAPLTVQFTDTSTGSPTGWSWDFGDGSPTSTEQNPSHVYTTPGTYTVTLTASNDSGPSTPARLLKLRLTMSASRAARESTRRPPPPMNGSGL